MGCDKSFCSPIMGSKGQPVEGWQVDEGAFATEFTDKNGVLLTDGQHLKGVEVSACAATFDNFVQINPDVTYVAKDYENIEKLLHKKAGSGVVVACNSFDAAGVMGVKMEQQDPIKTALIKLNGNRFCRDQFEGTEVEKTGKCEAFRGALRDGYKLHFHEEPPLPALEKFWDHAGPLFVSIVGGAGVGFGVVVPWFQRWLGPEGRLFARNPLAASATAVHGAPVASETAAVARGTVAEVRTTETLVARGSTALSEMNGAARLASVPRVGVAAGIVLAGYLVYSLLSDDDSSLKKTLDFVVPGLATIVMTSSIVASRNARILGQVVQANSAVIGELAQLQRVVSAPVLAEEVLSAEAAAARAAEMASGAEAVVAEATTGGRVIPILGRGGQVGLLAVVIYIGYNAVFGGDAKASELPATYRPDWISGPGVTQPGRQVIDGNQPVVQASPQPSAGDEILNLEIPE